MTMASTKAVADGTKGRFYTVERLLQWDWRA